MKVLVTGAGGQVGTELLQPFPGHEVVGVTHGELDVGDRDAVLAAVAAPSARRHGPRRGLDRGRRLRGRPRPGPTGSTPSAPATSPRPPAGGRPGLLRVHGLRVRRHQGRALRRVGRARTPFGLRPVEARRRAGARPDDTSCARPGCAAARAEHGRDDPAPGRRARAASRFVDDQRGHPTFADDLAGDDRPAGRSRPAGPVPRHQPGRGVLVRVRPGRAGGGGRRPRAGASPITTADLDPPRPAPRPANSVLDNAALRLSGIPLLDHHEVPLHRLVGHLVSEGVRREACPLTSVASPREARHPSTLAEIGMTPRTPVRPGWSSSAPSRSSRRLRWRHRRLSEDDFIDEFDDVCQDVNDDLADLESPGEGEFDELEDFAEDARGDHRRRAGGAGGHRPARGPPGGRRQPARGARGLREHPQARSRKRPRTRTKTRSVTSTMARGPAGGSGRAQR